MIEATLVRRHEDRPASALEPCDALCTSAAESTRSNPWEHMRKLLRRWIHLPRILHPWPTARLSVGPEAGAPVR